jgi:hypothetical protein
MVIISLSMASLYTLVGVIHAASDKVTKPMAAMRVVFEVIDLIFMATMF